MLTEEFNYDLPERLIAQHPCQQRDHSRLMVLDKKSGELAHKHFYDIVDLLRSDDVLVINNTKVMPARLYGKKAKSDTLIEVVLLRRDNQEKDLWEVLVKPGRRAKIGTEIYFGNGDVVGKVIANTTSGRLMSFSYEGVFEERLQDIGVMPLPPYIHEKLEDNNRYQTVYAKEYGSAAAPTAGLHFTPELIERLQNKGVQVEEILLHVGLGTFQPVKENEIEKHHMHREYYNISKETAQRINTAKEEGRRIIAVGTTSARTLESATKDGLLEGGENNTEIFIYPGYEWKMVDALITNFHLPKSTLMMLISALSTKEIILNAYQEAVREEYRFFSFGDAIFIQ